MPKLDLAQDDLQHIATGFMKGTLHTEHLDNIMNCMANPKEVVSSIEGAIAEFGKKDMALPEVMMALQKLGTSGKKMMDAIKQCDNDVTQEEMRILGKMVESFKEPKELAFTIGTNMVVNGVDIYREMSAAYTNYLAKEYESFGRDLGVSLTLVFIGASNAAKVDPGAAKVMESVAEMKLYPEISGQIYNDKNREAYIRFLTHVADSDEQQVPNLNQQLMNMVAQPQLVNLAGLQPIRIDQQTYANLINLMSNNQQGAYLY